MMGTLFELRGKAELAEAWLQGEGELGEGAGHQLHALRGRVSRPRKVGCPELLEEPAKGQVHMGRAGGGRDGTG